MDELAELHQLICSGTAMLIKKGRAVLPEISPICKLDSKYMQLPPDKKDILKKTCLLQNEVSKRQMEAQKRSKKISYLHWIINCLNLINLLSVQICLK